MVFIGGSMVAGAVGALARRFGKEAPETLIQQLKVMGTLKDSKRLYECLSKYKEYLVKIGFMKEEDLLLEEMKKFLSGFKDVAHMFMFANAFTRKEFTTCLALHRAADCWLSP